MTTMQTRHSRLPATAHLFAAVLLAITTAGIEPLLAQTNQPNPDAAKRRYDVERSEGEKRRSTRVEGHEEDARGRLEWFYFQRSYPYLTYPAGARAAAAREMKGMEERLARSSAAGRKGSGLQKVPRTWEPIGPVNIGGRITAVALHPTNVGEILIGAASGGVWRSSDNGSSWRTTFDSQSSLSIGAIDYDPSDPQTIYVGTGEQYSHSEEYFADGAFKSTDGGETWRNIGLRNVGGCADLHVHATTPGVVYYLGSKQGAGFYRSTDGGGSWSRTLDLDGASMSVDPTNNDIILVSDGGSVRRSTDAGRSWQAVTSGINVSGGLRISVAFAPSNPTIAYALIARAGGQFNIGEVYRSTNGGLNWSRRAQLSPYFFRDQGWYNNCIAVHPDSASVVLVGGIDVYRSQDGGTNFINYTNAYDPVPGQIPVHPDQHTLRFDPHDHDRVLVGNDGGLYQSTNGGRLWGHLSLDLPITQFYRMDVDPFNPDNVFGGSQDNGTSGTFGNGAITSWSPISGGDGFYVAVDPIDRGYVYSEIYYGSPIYRVELASGATEIIDFNITEQGGETGDWSTPLVVGPLDGRVYSGRIYLWRTSNGGGTWQRLAPGTSGYMSAVGLSFTDPTDLAVGTSYGSFAASTDDGVTWYSGTGLPRRTISDIRFDPSTPGRIYVTCSGFGSGHVFRSDDYGATFSDITANVPNVPVNTIAVDPENPRHLFIGTDAGAMVSLNGGELWLPFNRGLPLAPVVDLKATFSGRMLVAATHGRSMFRIRIDEILPEPVLITPAGGEQFIGGSELEVRWAATSGPCRLLLSMDGESFEEIASGVVGESATLHLPMTRTQTAAVRVEELEGDRRSITSPFFSISPRVNATSFGLRGARVGALAARGSMIWGSIRGSDSLVLLRTPLLLPVSRLQAGGLEGETIDMAWSSDGEELYILTDDAGTRRIFRVDTNGALRGELPAGSAAGVEGLAVTDQGIALLRNETTTTVTIVDREGSIVVPAREIAGLRSGERRGLSWDGRGLVCGANLDVPLWWASGEIERIGGIGGVEQATVVLSDASELEFYGLAHWQSDSSAPSVYFASDTSGRLYRFAVDELFAGVEGGSTIGDRRDVTLRSLTPNPARGATSIGFGLARPATIDVVVLGMDGAVVRELPARRLGAGEHTLPVDCSDLPAGVYMVLIRSTEGATDARRLVVVR